MADDYRYQVFTLISADWRMRKMGSVIAQSSIASPTSSPTRPEPQAPAAAPERPLHDPGLPRTRPWVANLGRARALQKNLLNAFHPWYSISCSY